MIEAGRVWLPREAHYLPCLENEIVNFPNGKYDDQVDTISQVLQWLKEEERRNTNGSLFISRE